MTGMWYLVQNISDSNVVCIIILFLPCFVWRLTCIRSIQKKLQISVTVYGIFVLILLLAWLWLFAVMEYHFVRLWEFFLPVSFTWFTVLFYEYRWSRSCGVNLVQFLCALIHTNCSGSKGLTVENYTFITCLIAVAFHNVVWGLFPGEDLVWASS